MILRRLTLAPFAGFAKREIEFSPGLNVVCGPNDVGKSSLFRAIDAGFFLPAKVRANTVEGKNLRRLIPLGGDHARVSLEFSVGEQNYRLEKGWGADPLCRLELPDGSALTSAERVEEKLLALLPAPPATFQSVLLMPQNALERTRDDLAARPDSLHSLGDVLRKAMESTGGVSVDRLKARLRERLDESLGNWDHAAGTPKGLRGIENPWLKNNGRVIEAYYRRERAKKRWAEAQALERELGEKLQQLAERQARWQELRAFVETHQAAADSVALRRNLELQLAQAERDATALTADFSAWVQAESDRKLAEADLQRLEGRKAAVEVELKEMRANLGRRELRGRVEKVEAALAQADERRKTLAAMRAVKPEEMRALHQAQAALDQAKSTLSAGKLKLQFTAKQKLDLKVQKNFDAPRAGALEPGGALSIQSGSRIHLESDLFELTVVSGEGAAQEAERSLQKLKEAFDGMLAKLGVPSVEEAQLLHDRWLAAAALVREAEGVVAALLGRDKVEDLRRQLGGAESTGGRDLETVEKEFRDISQQYADRRGVQAAAARSLEEISRRHGVRESSALAQLMAKRVGEAEGWKPQLAALPPLPDGVGSADAFVQKFRAAQSQLPLLAEEVRLVSNVVADLKARMPEESAQSYERQFREGQAEFDVENRRALALLRVESAMASIDQEAGDVFAEFRAGFERYVKALSGGKYAEARLQQALPADFLREDGAAVPFDWLSAGTKDSFALALRLSMARYFLGKGDGFLLIDDPMVAMDPSRQKETAELLRSFADGSQVVVFTCHPAHAELLGGNLIHV